MVAISTMGWAAFVAIICVAILVCTWSSRQKRLKRFADRETLSLDAIYNQFFAARQFPKDLVVELWNEVANPLGVPPGKLRPTDRFDSELAPVEKWDDDIVEVQWAAERRLKKAGIKTGLSGIQTLDDYIEFFCRQARNNPAT